MSIEAKLKEMGLSLPGEAPTAGVHIPLVQVGNLVFCSGTTASINGEQRYLGKVGGEVTLEDGRKAARDATLLSLSNLQRAYGSLEEIERIVKLTVFVNVVPGYPDTPKVANGASEFLIALYGERGRHARSAIGVASLPGGHSVEVEMIVQLKQASNG